MFKDLETCSMTLILLFPVTCCLKWKHYPRFPKWNWDWGQSRHFLINWLQPDPCQTLLFIVTPFTQCTPATKTPQCTSGFNASDIELERHTSKVLPLAELWLNLSILFMHGINRGTPNNAMFECKGICQKHNSKVHWHNSFYYRQCTGNPLHVVKTDWWHMTSAMYNCKPVRMSPLLLTRLLAKKWNIRTSLENVV